MNNRFRPIMAFLVLTVVAMACALPIPGSPGPTVDEVATAVALTMQALTPASEVTATPTSEPEPAPAGLLPHSLHFINNDSISVAQVFRLGTDGKSLTQITSEPSAVGSYDVSPVDGGVAYVANNQLVLINADGSGRRILVDGGPIDPANPFITSLTSPVFSPDGQTIAYSDQGLVLYSLATGASNVVLEEMTTDPGSGATVPARVFIPQEYSPDGTKLLITAAIPNSDGFAQQVYTIASDSTVDITGGDGALLCCGQQAWSGDSSLLFTASSSLGMFGSGLWRIDAATGNVVTLLPTEAGGGNYNLARDPYLASDGQLYFFFVTAPSPDGFISRASLQMVRSAPDGVTGRTILRPDTFQLMNEALWAPDASFVITAIAPSDTVYAGGQLNLYYTDPSQPVISLLPFGQQLTWGP
jgi:WD40 repeat protein